MHKTIRYAAIAGIQLIILGLFLTIINMQGGPKTLNDFQILIYVIVFSFSLVFSIIFFWGFNIIGDKVHNNLLQVISHLFIFSSLIFHIVILMPLKPLIFSIIFNPDLTYPMFLFIGSIGILFGIGLIKLKKYFGMVAMSAGILEIIANIGYLIINLPKEVIGSLDYLMMGFTLPFISISGYLTVNLPIIPTLIIMSAYILQIIILFKAYKIINV